jgi:hypothetical protein
MTCGHVFETTKEEAKQQLFIGKTVRFAICATL